MITPKPWLRTANQPEPGLVQVQVHEDDPWVWVAGCRFLALRCRFHVILSTRAHSVALGKENDEHSVAFATPGWPESFPPSWGGNPCQLRCEPRCEPPSGSQQRTAMPAMRQPDPRNARCALRSLGFSRNAKSVSDASVACVCLLNRFARMIAAKRGQGVIR